MTAGLDAMLRRLQWYESIVQAAPVWCCIFDPDRDEFLFANDCMTSMVGPVVGHSYSDFVIESNVEDTSRVVEDQRNGSSVAGFVNVWRLLDGSTSKIEWFAQTPPGGSTICAVGIPRGR